MVRAEQQCECILVLAPFAPWTFITLARVAVPLFPTHGKIQ